MFDHLLIAWTIFLQVIADVCENSSFSAGTSVSTEKWDLRSQIMLKQTFAITASTEATQQNMK